MIEVNVYMLIIGKIIEEDLHNINMNQYLVQTGTLIILSQNINNVHDLLL
jgi:hypothetical protein